MVTPEFPSAVSLRVHSDRMRCDFFAANIRMRFTHASKKINETHVIQYRTVQITCIKTHAILGMHNFRCDHSQQKNATDPI